MDKSFGKLSEKKQIIKHFWMLHTSALGVQERRMKRASFPKLRASTHISSPSNFE